MVTVGAEKIEKIDKLQTYTKLRLQTRCVAYTKVSDYPAWTHARADAKRGLKVKDYWPFFISRTEFYLRDVGEARVGLKDYWEVRWS